MRAQRLGVGALVAVLILLLVPLTATSPPGIASAPAAHAENVFLVKFRNLPAPAVDALNRQFGTQSVSVIPGIGVHRLTVPPSRTVEEMVGAYRRLADVEFAELDYIAQTQDTLPNDTFFPNQWAPGKIKLPAAWDLEKGSGIVTVAVVDTGVDWTHPDLQGRFMAGLNVFDGSANTQDDHGHGTHVAGIIGAVTDNGRGVAGTNWQVSILPVKVLAADGSGTYSGVASGIVYAADRGAKVINLSLGGGSPSLTLESAVDYAWNKGAFLACAAGNGNGPVVYPAAFKNCTAIGATDPVDQKAAFSSYGPQLELTAPGVNILSTVPLGACRLCDPSGYLTLSGTSMATPHVAGLAALLFRRFSGASAADVRNQMEAQADDLGAPGWDAYFGYGRINAYRAVSNSLSPPVPPLPITPSPLLVEMLSPTSGSTVSGTVPVRVEIRGGSTPYQVVVVVGSKTRYKIVCDLMTTSTSVTCNWESRKGPAGIYTVGAYVYTSTERNSYTALVTVDR